MAAPSAATSSPASAGAVRRGAVARSAGDAGRDHAAAALVPVPSRQGVLLVAHGDRAAAGADGAEARARAIRAASRSQSCSSRRRHACATGRGTAIRLRSGPRSSCASIDVLRAVEPLFAERSAPARDRQCGRLRHRAAQRRGRARRDLSGHGQHGDDVRLPRLSAETIRDVAIARRVGREAAGRQGATSAYCQPCLSPVWDTALAGHALMEAGGERRRPRRDAASTG